MSRATQSASHSIIVVSDTFGSPSSAKARLASLSQAVGASSPTIVGRFPKRSPKAWASRRTAIVSGPVTLSGSVGVVQWREAAQRHRVRVALPDHVDVAHGHVDRLAVAHLAGDVVEHAVAQVDRVVQPEDSARRAAPSRSTSEHALAADAAGGVLAGPAAAARPPSRRPSRPGRTGRRCRSRRRRSGSPPSPRRRTPAERCSSPTCATARRDVPNFWPAMRITFGDARQACDRVAVEQVGADRLDAVRLAARRRRPGSLKRATARTRRLRRGALAPSAPASAPSCRRRRAA